MQTLKHQIKKIGSHLKNNPAYLLTNYCYGKKIC